MNIEALLEQRAWLRRLAGALTNDREAADDSIQETWVTALTSPPRSATRAWLKRVFLSRLYDDHRSQVRRGQREQRGHDGVVAQVETPEDLTLRMEMHGRLAEHIAALNEDLRQILFLRYVEDLEPIEIARRLGIPDGTVRWRLKRGLDELRVRLDAEAGGDRRRWMAALAPMASPSSARQRPGFSRAASIAGCSVLLVIALSLAPWRGCTPRSENTGLTEEGSSDDPANTPPLAAAHVSSPGDADARAAVEPDSPCPEAEALQAERDTLAKLTETFRTIPKDLFLKSTPNPVIDPRLLADVDEMFETPAQCGHSLECRGLACRLSVMVPESITKVKGWSAFECVNMIVYEKLASRILAGPELEYDGTIFDPISRIGFKKIDCYMRMASEPGSPAVAAEKTDVRLPPGWDRDHGPVPPRLAPACRARVIRVRQDLTGLVRQITRTMPQHIAFGQATPRPALARELADRLQPYLAAQGAPLPVTIECRGSLCALRPREEVEGSAIHWQCQENGKPGGRCWPRPDGDDWLGRLYKNYQHLSLDGLIQPWRFGQDMGPLYLIMPPRGAQQSVSWNWWALKLTRSLDYAGMVAACERRHPTKGFLTVMATVAETCGLAEQPSGPLITFQYGGELMGSALAGCLRSATEQALPRLERPDCTTLWVHEWRLEFPNPKIELTVNGEE